MPTRLERKEGCLALSISGENDEFNELLKRVKELPGRRWNPDGKVWELPDEPEHALRAVAALQPEMDLPTQAWIREIKAEASLALSNDLPTDADLEVAYAEHLFAFQRADVDFMARHPHTLNGNDMGLGKTVESIAAVTEYLLRCSNEQERISSSVAESESRACQSESPRSAEALPREDQGDHCGGKETSVHRLRGAASTGDHGPRSRSGPQAIQPGAVDKSEASEGGFTGAGDKRRDSEVCDPVSKLSPLAALPRLVVCPSKLRGTWADTLSVGIRGPDGQPIIPDWEPQPFVVIDGNPTKRREQLDEVTKTPGCWAIVNWERLRLMPELAEVEWLAVIADEVHRAKNRKAKQTKALWKLTAPIQLGLSGTPIINSPDDLWAILRWLRPEQYATHTAGGGYWTFFHTYVESYPTRYGPVCTGVRNPDALRFELADKMIRRTKTEELDLPEKVVSTVPIELNPGQRKLYDEAAEAFWLEVRQAVEAGDVELDEATDALQRGTIELLIPSMGARITRLRQIVSTPALLGAEDDSAKLDAAEEIIRDNLGKQFVVFCWYEQTTEILAERLRKGKPALRVERITGKTGDPTEVVKDFQRGEVDVLVNTIAAGGTGLTLTAADTAIFVEEDWTPALNQQAQDRLWRQGQKNHVTILNLRASDTIDTQRIAPKNRLKELIIGTVIGD